VKHEPEDDEGGDDGYPDTLGSADGDVHFGVDAQTFLIHWLGKLGLDVAGAAILVGEGPSIVVIHPETGEILTPVQIAKLAAKASIRSVQ
jgi:hypothetical protein